MFNITVGVRFNVGFNALELGVMGMAKVGLGRDWGLGLWFYTWLT